MADIAPRPWANATRPILDDFDGRLETVVTEGLQELMKLAGYRGLGQESFERVAKEMERSISTLMSCARERCQLNVEDDEFYRSLGADRAHRGIPLGALESAFQAVYHRALFHLQEVADEHEGPGRSEAAKVLTADIMELFAAALRTVKAGYEAATAGWLTPLHVAKRQIVADVLRGRIDEASLAARLSTVGVSPCDRWRMILVTTEHSAGGGLARAVAGVVAALPESLRGATVAQPAGHGIVLIPARGSDEPPLEHVARDLPATLISVAPTLTRLVGSAYERLRQHLHLVPLVAEHPQVLRVRDLARCAVVRGGGDDVAEWFVWSVLGPLLGPSTRRWDPIRSMLALQEAGGDAELAGAKLGLSARTMRHHRKRSGEFLQMAPEDETDRDDVALALWLLRYRDLPEGDDEEWTRRYA